METLYITIEKSWRQSDHISFEQTIDRPLNYVKNTKGHGRLLLFPKREPHIYFSFEPVFD
jgi:hypothetical protein